MRRGLNNAWTQKSLDRLAALKPDTYARAEISSGFVGSLERYVYQPPPRAVEAALGTPSTPEGAAAPATPAAPATTSVPATTSSATTSSAAEVANGQPLTAGAGNASSH